MPLSQAKTSFRNYTVRDAFAWRTVLVELLGGAMVVDRREERRGLARCQVVKRGMGGDVRRPML